MNGMEHPLLSPLENSSVACTTQGSALIQLWEGLPPSAVGLPMTSFATRPLSAGGGRTWANSGLRDGTEGLDLAPSGHSGPAEVRCW